MMNEPLIDKIKFEIDRNDKAVFLFDYDGTLTSIVDKPEQAFLSDEVKTLLMELVSKQDVLVGIVTGRGLKDIKNFVGLDVAYITNHGYLTEYSGKIITHDPFFNKSKHYQVKYNDIYNLLAKDFSGIQLELKEISTSFHYLNVAEEKQEQCREAIIKTVGSFFAPRELRIKEGKKVVELLPFKEMNKGLAIKDFLADIKKELQTEKLFVLFIGDDLTDEDGFKALNVFGGVTVKVGAGETSAQYRLNDVPQVKEFLATVKNLFAG